MTTGSSGADHNDLASAGGNQPRNKSCFHLGQWLGFWFPVVATGIGGLVLGSFFGLGAAIAWVATAWWYFWAFAFSTVACVFLPPFLVYRIMRWVQRETGESS